MDAELEPITLFYSPLPFFIVCEATFDKLNVVCQAKENTVGCSHQSPSPQIPAAQL